MTTGKKRYTNEQILEEAHLIVNHRIYDNCVDEMIRRTSLNDHSLDTWDADGLEALLGSDDNGDYAEMYFVIDEWLFNRLGDNGYIVGELFGLRIWGRNHNIGEAVAEDSIMEELAVEMLESKGIEGLA